MAAKPTVFGTGLSGMVGSRLVELFQDQFDFVNLDLATGVDITAIDQVEAKLSQSSPTAVIHLAAFTDVSKAYEQNHDKTGSVYKVNTLGTKNVATICKKFNHYLIHISTDFIFNGQNPPPAGGGNTETDTPHPIEWYGQTKLWAEEEVAGSGCDYVIARIAYPFRAFFPPKLDLVRNILAKLKANSLYPMFTDQIITPTFTDDICRALKLFIDKKTQGIYHLVGSTSLSPFDLAKKVAQVFNLQADIKPASFKAYMQTDPRPRQQYLKISNAKLCQDFGIKMKDIDAALQELKSQL